MIETNAWGRQTGKTTVVIKKMQENTSLYLLLPTERQKLFYPRDLHDRIFSAYDVDQLIQKMRSMNVKDVIMDEGYMYRQDVLARLYYYLGYYRIGVEIYGTLREPHPAEAYIARTAEAEKEQFKREYKSTWTLPPISSEAIKRFNEAAQGTAFLERKGSTEAKTEQQGTPERPAHADGECAGSNDEAERMEGNRYSRGDCADRGHIGTERTGNEEQEEGE